MWDERHPHDQLHSSNVTPNVTFTTARHNRPSTIAALPDPLPIIPRSDPVLGFPWPWVRLGPREAASDGWEGPLSEAHQLPRRRPNTNARAPLPGLAPSPGSDPLSPLRPFWPALACRWPHEPEGRALVVTCGRSRLN